MMAATKIPSLLVLAEILFFAAISNNNKAIQISFPLIVVLLIVLYISYMIFKKDKRRAFEGNKINIAISLVSFLNLIALYLFGIMLISRPKYSCKLGDSFKRIYLFNCHPPANQNEVYYQSTNVKKELKLIDDDTENNTFTLEYKISYNVISVDYDTFYIKYDQYSTGMWSKKQDINCEITKITLDGKNIELHEDNYRYTSSEVKKNSKVVVTGIYKVNYNEKDGHKAFAILNGKNVNLEGLEKHKMYNASLISPSLMVTTLNTPKSYYIGGYETYYNIMICLNICTIIAIVVPIIKIPVYITSKEKEEDE